MLDQNTVHPRPIVPPLARLLPGIGLCILVTAIAYLLQAIEIDRVGRPWLEALVFANPARRGDTKPLDTGIQVACRHRVQRQDPAGDRCRAVGRIGQRPCGIGHRAGVDRRYRDRCRRGDRDELRDQPGARTPPADGDPGRLRQLDLRQLRDRGRGPGHRRGRRGCRLVNRVHRRARRDRRTCPAAACAALADVIDAIWRHGRTDRLPPCRRFWPRHCRSARSATKWVRS